MFNWSEFHLSEMTCYKIHTLEIVSRSEVSDSAGEGDGDILWAFFLGARFFCVFALIFRINDYP